MGRASGAFDTCILLLHYRQMGRASGAFDTCILLLHYKQMGRAIAFHYNSLILEISNS
jgi:hypothetical protein